MQDALFPGISSRIIPKDLMERWRRAETASWPVRPEGDGLGMWMETPQGRYRILSEEWLGPGVRLGLLGARYARDGLRQDAPRSMAAFLCQRHLAHGRFYALMVQAAQRTSETRGVAVFVQDAQGDYALVDSPLDDSTLWPFVLVFAQLMGLRSQDPARYDDFGDFLVLGGHNLVERHSTDKRVRYVSRKIRVDKAQCTGCLQCVGLCHEMRIHVSPTGIELLGAQEDHCTHCGLCHMRCPHLVSVPYTADQESPSRRRAFVDYGIGIRLYGNHVAAWERWLTALEKDGSGPYPYAVQSLAFRRGPLGSWPEEAIEQIVLTPVPRDEWPGRVPGRGLTVTFFFNGNPTCLIRPRFTAGLLCVTEDGLVEQDLLAAALHAGLEVRATGLFDRPVTNFRSPTLGSSSVTRVHVPANEVTRWFKEQGLWDGRSIGRLWREGDIDLILAPRYEDVPAKVHAEVLRDVGREGLILSPHLPQKHPVTKSPLLNGLTRHLQEIFLRHPELLQEEATIAQKLLNELPQSAAQLHARYGPMAFAGGHSACPSCAEAQVLAIPVAMAIAMSLARGEVPQVAFTCETGCMSETLNKMNEAAQKVPGGRTVFGGGFAFGEAMSQVLDRAVRMGLLKKGRRYVVSQGGDGGAVIGLPAWLNALRQQAFLIRQRWPNVLHFITVTDTQVYSNTGGESSASSLLGMGTLTTPIGKFLMGNQRVQWTLINLAAEFPGVLVGMGHSGDRAAAQEFWLLADRLGQSAMRWDVTPCPETGKFFGQDPDDYARIMAHAGMLPEVVFYGRYRKRVAPFHPEDRGKPYEEWRMDPKPVLYWISRDPRYKALLKRDEDTGQWVPRNALARFLIMQLETYRDQMNWQIDLETRLILQAERRVRAFMDDLRSQWASARVDGRAFPYAVLFDDDGRLKPHFAETLERDMVLRLLGQETGARYADLRDGFHDEDEKRWRAVVRALESLEAYESGLEAFGDEEQALNRWRREARAALEQVHKAYARLRDAARALWEADPIGKELFQTDNELDSSAQSQEGLTGILFQILDRLLEERTLAAWTELQQYRLSQQLRRDFLQTGGLIRVQHVQAAGHEREALRQVLSRFGPFTIAVASLAGDRGIAINRVFAQFLTAKGCWAGMSWQFGSSKRGTPVLSATFVDSRPLERKDAMFSFDALVVVVTNFEEMKRDPHMLFGSLRVGGTVIVNHWDEPERLWTEVVRFCPENLRVAVMALRQQAFQDGGWSPERLELELDRALGTPGGEAAFPERDRLRTLCRALVSCRMITVDMDGIMERLSGRSGMVSNLVAVSAIFDALVHAGLPFNWDRDKGILTRGFPGAVLKNPELLALYEKAMDRARSERHEWPSPILTNVATGEEVPVKSVRLSGSRAEADRRGCADDPGDALMIMGGTLAGMVLSQIALPEHPLFYVGFPITPAGNPFYAMAEAFANGHPYIVVDELNPSEKVAAEKLLGVARTGMFLPVTFTASQGWRLFTEIIPQFVGARLEGLFLLAKRALAAPNLNIEESHTDFMSFRDDGGIMLAPKSIQEYVPCLYLARLLTHFAKLPVILSIGGITDTHKIGLVRVPPDAVVRRWLTETLQGFDFSEHRIVNADGHRVVHGPSCTAATYQETQSEVEKAHEMVRWVWPKAVEAVRRLTGVQLHPLEVRVAGSAFEEASVPTTDSLKTLLVLQGSLFPNAVEALQELEEEGWRGMGCVSVRLMNPFPEEELQQWLKGMRAVAVLDRSNSFGSIPPLASRVFNACARLDQGAKGPPPAVLRSLVGGLGGREITVPEMKELLLSTHLLFSPLEPWEREALKHWIQEDDTLKDWIEELTALHIRALARHTRVPKYFPGQDHEAEESFRKQLHRRIIARDYVGLLAHYNQVEFVGPREVYEETELRRRLIVELEKRLARLAANTGRSDARRALVLLHYGGSAEDREKARHLLAKSPRESVSAALLRRFGLDADALPGAFQTESPTGPLGEPLSVHSHAVMEEADKPTSTPWTCVLEDIEREIAALVAVPFEAEEAARIEKVVRRLVNLSCRRAMLLNPEDYDRLLLEFLAQDETSQWSRLRTKIPQELIGHLETEYLWTYRDVIDRWVQREVIGKLYAPEIEDFFEGQGRGKLQAFLNGLSDSLSPKQKRHMVEEYVRRHVLVGTTKTQDFYLEYFRTWVWPDLSGQGAI
ncbi:hypothetical protein [Desulfosoma caldarium]|uniref:Pyruvate/2-oxoacid:ferredoxin oxidoreductase alpha subunit n=1 Tax=Desulfosoma caldarium TaxID=610254 RepID=A0A3N1VS54_9BACT|nr:hypothetical protein [Desulfosoma caldarium]ROR03072.1 pyruvate/2-oxoacid:ferredoxin oxidoreductase alpha subunit [Desulfosoma caldarium]